MKAVFTINRADNLVLEEVAPFLSAADTVVLIEDGVVHSIKNASLLASLSAAKYCVLIDDVRLRGLDDTLIGDIVEKINYDGFVDICFCNSKVVAW